MSILSLSELMERPQPAWLVAGVLHADSLAIVWGEERSFKSFLALDLACCIAHGQEWHGHAVQSGPVVYVAAEGGRGIRKRVQAWVQTNQADLHRLPVVVEDEPVPLLHPGAIDAWCDALAARRVTQAKLTVFDTWAMCSEGADENAATDFHAAARAMLAVRHRLGGTVLLVAHGPPGRGPRGSKAQRQDVDALIHVQRQGTTVTLTNAKQRDDAEFGAITLQTAEVCVGTDGDGKLLTSLVVVDADALPSIHATRAEPAKRPRRRGGQRGTRHSRDDVLRVVARLQPARLRDIAAALGTGEPAARNHLRAGMQAGLVCQDDAHCYSLTARGLARAA
jgi:hypothetical protein